MFISIFHWAFVAILLNAAFVFLAWVGLSSHRKPLGVISRAHSQVSVWFPNILFKGINFLINILVTTLGNQSIGESLSCLQGCTIAGKKQVKIMFIQQHKATRVQLHKMTNLNRLELTRRMLIIHTLLLLKCCKECSKPSLS